MEENKVTNTILYVVKLLVDGSYRELVEFSTGRLNAQEIQDSLEEYPCTLVYPPNEELSSLVYGDIMDFGNFLPKKWSIDVLLYTIEEGRSDLTLSLTITDTDTEMYTVEIDGIHVL